MDTKHKTVRWIRVLIIFVPPIALLGIYLIGAIAYPILFDWLVPFSPVGLTELEAQTGFMRHVPRLTLGGALISCAVLAGFLIYKISLLISLLAISIKGWIYS